MQTADSLCRSGEYQYWIRQYGERCIPGNAARQSLDAAYQQLREDFPDATEIAVPEGLSGNLVWEHKDGTYVVSAVKSERLVPGTELHWAEVGEAIREMRDVRGLGGPNVPVREMECKIMQDGALVGIVAQHFGAAVETEPCGVVASRPGRPGGAEAVTQTF